jgi:hypothetical protein
MMGRKLRLETSVTSFAGGLNVVVGRSTTFLPLRMNFCSASAGGWGGVIFWRHVGHSMTVPHCDESHLMCCPHTGQAYLNSLMADGQTFHIHAATATWNFMRTTGPECRTVAKPEMVMFFQTTSPGRRYQ